MKTTFKHLVRTLCTAAIPVLGAFAFGAPASAQEFPTRPVKIIVPFSVGSAADIVARRLGQGLGELWGKGVVIENIAGAAGNIGAAAVAKAPGDGHTLLMLGVNNVINPSIYKDIPFDLLRDFKPIARVVVAPMAIVASPALPAANIQQLVSMAKTRSDPIYYASGGNGSVTHLAVEMLKSRAGIPLTHVPYKSIAPMLTDIIGNQVSLGAPAAASVLSHAKAGTLKVLAVTTAKRLSTLPNVPTIAESGYPGFDLATWNGLMAPSATPDWIINKIHADASRVANSKAFVDQMHAQAMEVDMLDPAAYGTYLKSELDKWSKLVRDSGAKLE